jgi:hypothetical protein
MYARGDDRFKNAFRCDLRNFKLQLYTPNFDFHGFHVVEIVYINFSRRFQINIKDKLRFLST